MKPSCVFNIYNYLVDWNLRIYFNMLFAYHFRYPVLTRFNKTYAVPLKRVYRTRPSNDDRTLFSDRVNFHVQYLKHWKKCFKPEQWSNGGRYLHFGGTTLLLPSANLCKVWTFECSSKSLKSLNLFKKNVGQISKTSVPPFWSFQSLGNCSVQ